MSDLTSSSTTKHFSDGRLLQELELCDLRIDPLAIARHSLVDSIRTLRTASASESERSRASATLAQFGPDLVAHVLDLITTPKEDAALTVMSLSAAPEARYEIDSGITIRHLREYLSLVGPGSCAALDLITKELQGLKSSFYREQFSVMARESYASWARAFIFAGGAAEEILPTLRDIREWGKTPRHCGFHTDECDRYMNILIDEIQSGNVTRDASALRIHHR